MSILDIEERDDGTYRCWKCLEVFDHDPDEHECEHWWEQLELPELEED